MITNLNDWRKINEGIVNKNSTDNIFNYKSQIDTLWGPIIKRAQEFQHINFDLENNESTGQKKILYVNKNLRVDQPVKYQFNIELCEAGGDWEFLVMYFKIEFVYDYNIVSHGIKLEKPKYIWDIDKIDYSGLYNHYVIIPNNDHGNHLMSTKDGKGWTAATDDIVDGEHIKLADLKITKDDKKKAWKWIIDLLSHLVHERHEMLDNGIKEKPIEITKPDTI